ncbi:MAG: hypothetical protein FGM14_08270 [Flavobacteriales bacterium]|nr:hypothetical protein [Flavobacteriales bacterium]
MRIEDLERLFSKSRLETYYRLFPNERQKAIEYYQINTQIAEALYPLLLNFEIVLRNSIHNSFTIHFKTENWYEKVTYPELIDQIKVAKSKIYLTNKIFTIDKLVSELTLGFWTALFNKKYAKDYWKPLMHAFPLMASEQKQRSSMSFKLNNIRKFRNRIFHYEPICNDLNMLKLNHDSTLETLLYINTEIVQWIKQIDRFEGLLIQAKNMNPKQ